MRLIFAAVLSAFAVGASAQSVGQKSSMEPATSPFTYEVLGATPSLRLHQKSQPKSETPANTTTEQKPSGKPAAKTSAVEPTNELAASGDRNHLARGSAK